MIFLTLSFWNLKLTFWLPFYIIDQRIFAYQRYLHVCIHVGILAARIFREMLGAYFAYRNHPCPALLRTQCCRFSPVNNFARTVECTSAWTFYGTCFICVRAFLSPAIFMLSCLHSSEFEIKVSLWQRIKKKIAI